MKVKVCGLTRVSDAALASELGAYAVGLVFWERSPRAIVPAQAAEIVATLPAAVTAFGVFVNATAGWVCEVVDHVGLGGVQLHGEETPEYCMKMSVPVMKAVSVGTASDVETALLLPDNVTPLIDVHDPVRRGGTGRTVEWTAAATVAKSRQTFLAGGLGPENVAEAIRAVRPYGVDASSGLETSPGVKDPERLRAFFAAVRESQGNGSSDG